MTIGKLATETGVPASTIRYWERIGVVPGAARVNGNAYIRERRFTVSPCFGWRRLVASA